MKKNNWQRFILVEEVTKGTRTVGDWGPDEDFP